MTLFFNRHWCLISCCLDDVDVALEKNMDALIFPFNVEVVDYLMPEHLLEVFLFFISWPPKMMIPDIMICEKGFKLWSMFCGFFAFLDITWNHEQMRPHCCCRRLKNLDIVAKVMVVDRFIRPCCLCWCWVVLFHLFFFWFLIYFLDAILKSVDIWMQNMWHTFCGLFAI